MIIHPFGFLGTGELEGFQGTYKNLMRSLGAFQYFSGQESTNRYNEELIDTPVLGGSINHNTSGGPDASLPAYLNRPSAVGTQFHRWNTGATMSFGNSHTGRAWFRWPNTPTTSGFEFVTFNAGGSNQTRLIYGGASNVAYWDAQRSGVTKNLNFESFVSANTWHYISWQWAGDGSLWLGFDGIIRASDAHAGAFNTALQIFWVIQTADWVIDYAGVTLNFGFTGALETGESTIVGMNRPYWVFQDLVGYECDAFSLSPTYFFRLDSPSGVETDPIGNATLTFSGSPNRAQTSIIPGTENACIDWVPSARAVVAGLTGWTSSDGFSSSMCTICDSTAETWAYELAAQAPSPALVLNFGGVTGDVTVGLYDGGPTNRSLTFSGVDWGTASMHHIVHAGTQNVDHKLYVDGVEVANGVLTAVAGWGQVGTNNHLADNDTGAGNNYDGRMQDFKLYKRELTALEVALDNAAARNFDTYEFEIAKRLPAMYIRCVDVDEYPTNKFQAIIGPNYGTRSGSVLTNRTGPQFVQDAGHLTADFDGTNDHIALTDPDLDTKVNGTGNFTISAWAYFDSFGTGSNTGRVIIRNDNSYMLYQFNDLATLTGVQFFLTGITVLNSDRPQYPLSSMSTGQWYHFVATYDSTAGEAKLYVDGVLQSTKTGLSGTLANPSGAQTRIGESSGGFYDMDGSICHVTVDAENTWTQQQAAYSYHIGTGKTKADAYALSLLPVAYWPLDETAGTTANDQSGNSFNGTYTSTYTLNQATPLVNSSDPSVNFGSPGYVVGTHDFGMNGNTKLTIACWIKVDDNSVAKYFFSKHQGTAGWASIRLYRSSGNLVRLYLEDGVRNPYWEIAYTGTSYEANPPQNPWYHVCFVWDRVGATGASTDVTAYFNGVLVPSNTINYVSSGYTGFAFTFSESSQEWRIASLATNSGTQAEFTGNLSKMIIIDDAISADLVRGLYMSGLEYDVIP